VRLDWLDNMLIGAVGQIEAFLAISVGLEGIHAIRYDWV
jgi:hypothetical protein